MKESIRNTKSRDELSAEILEILEKIMEMHRLKKFFFVLFCMYKMVLLLFKIAQMQKFTQ